MKLRNKKTGEIYAMWHICIDGEEITSVKQFNDTFEDYEPKEPLIKDEKIRMAVKAWAQQYDHDPIRVYINSDYITLYKDDINGYSSSAGIDLSPDVFEGMPANDKYYTITELCGEEE